MWMGLVGFGYFWFCEALSCVPDKTKCVIVVGRRSYLIPIFSLGLV